MKILQVLSFFSPVHGGSAEAPYHLSKELAKRGHEVTIYTSDYKISQEYINSVTETGVKVCSFKTWLGRFNPRVTPGIIKSAKEQVKYFDIVHMHNYRTFQNIAVHHYAKKYNVPYVLQARGDVPYANIKIRMKKIFDILFGYAILKDASKLIALTEREVEDYKKVGVDDKKIEIVPNGIDLSGYDNLPKRGEFRLKYGIRDDEKIILYLGRIHKIKGINLLVNAFADLIKELEDVKLVIAGPDDGFLSTLKRQIGDLNVGDKILLTGPLYERDKLKAYVDADVYVLPSVYETFPNTVLEAWACGTPVVVTDRCGIADIVSKVGYVVEYDKDQLREAIFKVLSDEELSRRFGEKGKKLVHELFNLSKVVEQIEEVYQKCISIRLQ